MAKKESKKADVKTKSGGKSKLMPAFILLGIIGLFVLPLTAVVVCGLIPTLAMMVTDKSRGRSVSVAVGALNLTGVIYLAIQLVRKGMGFDYALRLLSDPANWLIMWGGAGLGYMLLKIVPPIVAQILTSISEFKSQKLKANLSEIRKIWGDNVKAG